MESFGILSLIPPATVVILAVATRQVLPSLFVSVWLGATIMAHGNPLAGFAVMIEHHIAGSIANPWNAAVLTYSLTLGGMIGVITRSGGITAMADSLAGRARTARGGQITTFIMGLVMFFDDYANTMIVGTTLRPVTDRLRISREKLAYLCDSTAAPVCSIALISTWTAYEMGVIRGALETVSLDMSPYGAFIMSVPFRFYSIAALGLAGTVAIMGRDFGPMLKAERRARTTGKVTADGSVPLISRELIDMAPKSGVRPRLSAAILPITTLLAVVAVGFYIHGRMVIAAENDTALLDAVRVHPLAWNVIRDVLGRANSSIPMMWAAFAGVLVAAGLAIVRRALTLTETVEAWVQGVKSFVPAALILVFAWGIGGLCKEMGTAAYIVNLLGGSVPAAAIPVMTFGVSCLIAFATGTAYGTAAIVTPIAIPLAFHLDGTGQVLFATIGAVFSGAVFGDHCSPISDTTVMSSMASACDHIDHVKTQIPYALVSAACAAAIGFIPAGMGLSPLVSVPCLIAATVLIVRLVGRKT